jgi:hypothetical protein
MLGGVGRLGLVLGAIAAAVLAAWLAVRGGEGESDVPQGIARPESRIEEPPVQRLPPPPREEARARARVAEGSSRFGANVKVFRDSGPVDRCLDIVFVGDGYTQQRLDDGTYARDVERVANGILEAIPFRWYADAINVRAVYLASLTEGCDVRHDEDRVDTALDVCFSESTDRLMRVRDLDALSDALRHAGPPEAVLVLVNTPFYGGSGGGQTLRMGGGAFRIAVFSPRDRGAAQIALHEMGHSLAKLADEYDNPGDEASFPLPSAGQELDAPNVQVEETLERGSRADLARTAKWRHLMALPGADEHAWAHEGGYYRRIGIWRPWRVCRMRSHRDEFCPVCAEEISKAIVRATGKPWKDAAWHAEHPLSTWAR